jgi:uncharacterized membrane protein
MAPPSRARHGMHRTRFRLLLALVGGLVTWLALPERFGEGLRLVAAWDTASLTMITLAWWFVLRADPGETRLHAAEDDPGRHVVGGLVVLASIFALGANAVVLRDVRTCTTGTRGLYLVLCIVAVTSAWLLTHTAYTLRYAHLYYRDDGDGEGGLGFPDQGPPALIDFAYFAFTIGMCFQVSDVTISTRLIRREVLGHSLLSFAYNTAILATAINLAVGVFG